MLSAIMKNIIFFIFINFILTCKSKNESRNLNIKKDSLYSYLKNDTLVEVERNIFDLKSFDTVGFTGMMKMEEVLSKYDEGKHKIRFYKKFIDRRKINISRIIKEKHTKEEIVYLGKLRDLTKNQSYYIVTNFTIWGIGLMLSPRGHSDVAFLSEKFDKIVIYHLSMPYELPKQIKGNVLYFKPHEDLIGISISGGLPPILCVPTLGCY